LLDQELSTWAKIAVDVGSIDPVLAAMNNHPAHAVLQFYACCFLCRLSIANKDYRNRIIDAKGLVPIVEAQRIHKADATVVQAARRAYDAIISIANTQY
jgi:hypothetical protein